MPRFSRELKFAALLALVGFLGLAGDALVRHAREARSLAPTGHTLLEALTNPFGIRGRSRCIQNLKQISLCISSIDSIAMAGEQDVADEERHPGLVATYRDNARPTPVEVMRLEPTLALALGNGEAPHPRLAADEGTVHWEGTLNILRAGSYRFQAAVRGRFRLTLDGKEVLAIEGKDTTPVTQETGEVRLEAGSHPLRADFTRLPGTARLEVSWQSPYFHREPLPYDVLGHDPKQMTRQLEDDALEEHGRLLAEERNCTSCHRPEDGDRLAKGLLKRQGPDLSQVGRRVHPGWIYRWLEAPQKLRPGAAMPCLFDDDSAGRVERYAVARYLASLGGPVAAPDNKEPRDKVSPRVRDLALFTSIGCLACHRDPKDKGAKEPAESSFYGLGPVSRVRATYPLTGLGSKTTVERMTAYLSNPLAVDPSGRMPDMKLQGKEAEDLARYLCSFEDAGISRDLPAAPPEEDVQDAFARVESRADELKTFRRLSADDRLRDLGKRLVIDRGCNNCHTIAPGGKPFASVLASSTFDDLKKPDRQESGCLAADAGKRGKAPRFAFDDRDRAGLRRFLTRGTRGSGSPAPAYAARVAFKRFNCLACHGRDGEGGLTPELVEDLRHYERAENAEAVTPPPLTGVGHKLRTPWLREVLVGAGRARPWMGLRMPQFGEAQVGRLPDALAALEGTAPENEVHKVPLTSAKIEAGRHLIGKNAFGCISCHDLARIPNTGTRGPDLAFMNQRVRYDWYRRWLEQPQRMSPGTRMPTVFNGGKSTVENVLGGSPDAQAEAMWAYLSLGPGLPLPEGLGPPKGMVLTVNDRPVLLRSFMPDAGSRAVAVGYLGGVAAVFDAVHCRLCYAWSGNFLDVAPVWDNRGGSPARVLGDTFWKAPAGCPWGLTTSETPPDFTARAKDPAYGGAVPEGKLYTGPQQLDFEGYSTDHAGVPTFRYRVQAAESQALEVTERPEPVHVAVGVGLVRHFTLHGPPRQTAWLLAGEANRQPRLFDAGGAALPFDPGQGTWTEVPAAGRFVVLPQDGERVVVLNAPSAPEGSRWHLQRAGDHWQALLRLPPAAASGPVHVDLSLRVPYRDEPALLKELLSAK
jgi:cbb3-type cytochrome oxidase cytochrome c subunit/cytochrome c551/c552